jgi:uncharacterized repeat protein (TIGR01451 family)
MSRPLLTALSLACILVLTAFQPYAPPEPPDTVTDRAWQATAQNSSVDIVVTALGYPDLAPARALTTKEAKTRFVTNALLAHADQAQAQLRAELQTRGLRHLPLWISNQILVKDASRADVLWLGNRADVTKVDVDEQVKGIEARLELRDWVRAKSPISNLQSPSAIEWGVQRINAPQVWAQGYTGQGIVVANLDTGVRWDHDALKPKYRGWNGSVADHNYNWFDPTAFAAAPVDVNGHGTHTTGTAVGDDGAGNQIGVAPGAQWIACRNMAGASGIGSVALYTACFQFALAPTDVAGNSPDPSKGADITSNSWGCDPSFGEVGCEVPTALITVTQTLRNAGVMVVASAGNNGASGCRSVINAPGMLDQAFAVGATGSDANNTIAGFSSRGPSSLTNKVKPDLVAPGVSVRSAQRSAVNAYGNSSGTSMAAPHVAGVAALVWSAAPWLRGNVDMTEAVLRASAKPLSDPTTCFGTSGTALPNNTYGYGLIDARAAVTVALSIVPITSGPAQAEPNAPITFTLTSQNGLSVTLQNIVLTSTLPASATLISSSPPGVVNGTTISWQAASLAPSATLSVTFVVSTTELGIIANSGVLLSADGLATTVPGKTATALVTGPRMPRAYLPLMAHE